MNQVIPVQDSAKSRPALALYHAPLLGSHIPYWRINGFPATIIIWTADEWEHLIDRPDDAQYFACGVWCALRML